MSFTFLEQNKWQYVSIGLDPKLPTALGGEATYSAVAQRNVWKLNFHGFHGFHGSPWEPMGAHGAVSL